MRINSRLLWVVAATTLNFYGVRAFVPSSIARPAFATTMTTTTTTNTRRQQTAGPEFALLFDCDGVILETEELHRLAYNEAFRKFDLTLDGEPVVWSVSRHLEMGRDIGRADVPVQVQCGKACMFASRSLTHIVFRWPV
jgi:hypothetical protein